MKLNYEDLTSVGLGVLAVLVSTLIVWLFLARAARQARRHFDALLSLAQDSPDPQHEMDVVQRRMTALRLVVNAAKYALFVGAILTTLRIMRVPLDSLLLPAGFLGAALGLGAQNLVRDVVAGLFIVFEGQFAVGDIVSINNTVGTVDEIGLRVTRLRDESGQLHFFPNGAITAVARYPDRNSMLIAAVPLADSSQATTAEILVRATIKHFGEDYGASVAMAETDAIKTKTNTDEATSSTEKNAELPSSVSAAMSPAAPASPESASGERTVGEKAGGESTPLTLRFRLSVRPTRANVTREKLPGRISAALEAAGIKIMAGAEVVIFNAPAGDPLLKL